MFIELGMDRFINIDKIILIYFEESEEGSDYKFLMKCKCDDGKEYKIELKTINEKEGMIQNIKRWNPHPSTLRKNNEN